jgi:hypothetical protein
MCRLSRNLGASTSWKPVGLSRPVMGLLYLYLSIEWLHWTCCLPVTIRLNSWSFVQLFFLPYSFCELWLNISFVRLTCAPSGIRNSAVYCLLLHISVERRHRQRVYTPIDYFKLTKSIIQLIRVAARSKAWVCGRSHAAIVGSNSAGGMDVCVYECCLLSDRDVCVRLIARPEESYRVWCVWVWRWSLDNGEALALLRHWKKHVHYRSNTVRRWYV